MKTTTGWSRLVGSALLMLATACASLPSDYPIPPPNVAMESDPSTVLGGYVAAFTARQGEGASGFAPIDGNGDA